MAVEATELTTLRDALLRARAAGVRTVTTSDGKSVTYTTDREMAAALADLERRIAATAGARPNRINIQSSKGL